MRNALRFAQGLFLFSSFRPRQTTVSFPPPAWDSRFLVIVCRMGRLPLAHIVIQNKLYPIYMQTSILLPGGGSVGLQYILDS